MENEFIISGFLGNNSNTLKQIENQNQDLFKFNYKLNLSIVKSIHQIKAVKDDPVSLSMAALFINITTCYQSTHLLIKNGLTNDAFSLLRKSYSALFKLSAINKTHDLAETYISADLVNRKILTNIMINNNQYFKGPETIESLRSQLIEIEKDIKLYNAKDISDEEWSKKANMHVLYSTAYRICSQSVHASSRNIESQYVLDENKNIHSLKYGPDYNVSLPLFSNTSIGLMAVKEAISFFKIDSLNNEIDLMFSEFLKFNGVSLKT